MNDKDKEIHNQLMKEDKSYRFLDKAFKLCMWVIIIDVLFLVSYLFFWMPYVSITDDNITSKWGYETKAYYSITEDKIVMLNNNTDSLNYKIYMRHELCHQELAHKNKSASQNDTLGRYFNEMNCYASGYLLWWQE